MGHNLYKIKYVTNCMDHSPSSEASRLSNGEATPYMLRNLKIIYCVHKSPTCVPYSELDQSNACIANWFLYIAVELTPWHTQPSMRRPGSLGRLIRSRLWDGLSHRYLLLLILLSVSRWYDMSNTVWKLKKWSIEWCMIRIYCVDF
jgi:hypothetical protein